MLNLADVTYVIFSKFQYNSIIIKVQQYGEVTHIYIKKNIKLKNVKFHPLNQLFLDSQKHNLGAINWVL